MPSISRHALVPFSAEQMFNLVDDIEAYPDFLPWCRSTLIHGRDSDQVKASIEIAKAGINKSFTTHNLNQKNKMIEMRLVEGPFKHLQGFWHFEQLSPNACKVSLDIEFEFSSKLISMTLGPLFSQICNTLVESFVKRAKELYG